VVWGEYACGQVVVVWVSVRVSVCCVYLCVVWGSECVCMHACARMHACICVCAVLGRGVYVGLD
jgi:hypothetical protein